MADSDRNLAVRIERLRLDMRDAFEGLLRIYREAIPQSERKTDDALSRMLKRSDYELLIALVDDAVAGFSIVKAFGRRDSCLLEYMAVDRSIRGRGVGGALFRGARESAMTAARYVLLEVDSEAQLSADHEIRARRKSFYRNLGCREVAGLSYLMPSVTTEQPPRMNLLVYRRVLPGTIDKSELRQWLQCIYAEVYQQPVDDPRIDFMLSGLTDRIALR
jgi:ribosomal protein S18 acetylase RimI-like enzyme